MKKKLVSIILSIMVAVTFMPLAADYTFAEDTAPAVQQQFNPGVAVSGIRVASYTYKSVCIAWNGVSMAQGYKVYRATKKKGKYKLAATVGGAGFNDTKNKSLSKYKYYKIRAYGNVNGQTVLGPYSGVFKARPAIPQVSGARTVSGSGKITFAWNKVAGAKKYRVYRATSPNGKYKKLTTTKKCSYTKSATTGQRYYFKVRAYRGSKKGPYSAIVDGVPTPSAPAGVRTVQNGSGLQTTWAGVPQAYAYEIYRSENPATGFTYLSGVSGTSYTDTTGLEDGKTYFYKVRAVASAGGATQAGAFSANSGTSRAAVIGLARSYKGIKEYSSQHKDIVNTYNSYGAGRIGYGDAWCAAFVSAIEIKAGNASLIPIGAYCPTMLSKFKNKTTNKSYHPNTADVIFFDWNANAVPDHVGFVDNYNASTNTVTTIEGNYSDTVKCRTFTPGKYSNLLAYGLPAYKEGGGVTYVASPTVTSQITTTAAQVAPEEVQAVSEQALKAAAAPEEETAAPEEQAVTEEETAVEEAATEEVAEPTDPDYDKVVEVAEVIQEEQPAAEVTAEESTYDAFLVKEACENMGIEACVVTEIDANGDMNSYNEIIIDGQIYILDASEGTTPEEYVPETIY